MRHTYTTAMTRGVFPHEGGFFDHPSDPGGPTNFGITIHDARKHWKSDATAADVRNMPKSVAESIYRKHYAAPMRYDDLPAGLDYCVLDYGINSGIGRSGKVLRRVLGLPDNTWQVTDEVLKAVAKRDPAALVKAICDERLAFLQRLKTWPVFGKGWGRRVREVRALALELATQQPAIVTNAPANGRGEVAHADKAIKGAVVAGTTATAAGGASLWDWLAANPRGAVLAGVACALAIAVGAYLVKRARDRRQDAPTPGIAVVPVKA